MPRIPASIGSTLLLVVLSVTAAHADNEAAVKWEEDPNQAYKLAREQDRLLLLYFEMDDCVYCRKMEGETLADPAVVANIKKDFVAATVKGEDYPELVRKFQVRSFPTTVIISPTSGVVAYMPGYIKTSEFLAKMNASNGGDVQRRARRPILNRRR